jgi:hypothetical protein
MSKHGSRSKGQKLIITPQGSYAIRFTYGWRCGAQQTDSIGVETWDVDHNRYSAGGVLTHQDVADLIDYLQRKQKNWEVKG